MNTDNWKHEEHNGRVHIKDENGQYRIRIDSVNTKDPAGPHSSL